MATHLDTTQGDVGALIVENIDNLQAAFDSANTKMAYLLGKHMIETFDTLISEIDGDGDDPAELDDVISIARQTWRKPPEGACGLDHYCGSRLKPPVTGERSGCPSLLALPERGWSFVFPACFASVSLKR